MNVVKIFHEVYTDIKSITNISYKFIQFHTENNHGKD